MLEIVPLTVLPYLNRVRGNDNFLGIELPGRALWWVTPVVGFIAWLISNNCLFGLTILLGYFFWGTWAWGRWYDLGHQPDGFMREGKEKTSFEKVIEYVGALLHRGITYTNLHVDYANLFVRHSLVFVLIPFTNYPFVWVLFPFIAVIMAHIGWKYWPENPIYRIEYLHGGLWAVCIFITGYFQ